MFRITLVAAAAAALAAQTASAQLTLAIDIQGVDYQFRGAGGAAAFGGVSHTGTLEWTSPDAFAADTRIGDEDRFGRLAPVSQSVPVRQFAGELTFENGLLTGGSLAVTLDNAELDTYTAWIKPGSGRLTALSFLGYTIDGLTDGGAFSDSGWGDVDVTPWYEGQLAGLPGALFQFRFLPGPQASGTADIELFVMVPLPPAAWAGCAMLGGLGAWGHVRRRRGAVHC